MKEIGLSRGMVALVDDEDYEYLKRWKWYAWSCGGAYYAVRSDNKNNKKIYMHRVIMGTPLNLEVDHINHNGLDNRKINLRNCTCLQNHFNKRPLGKSKYIGVTIDNTGNRKGRIRSQIKINGKVTHLGTYRTEEDAAYAYDEAARKHHGEFANLNFK